MGPLDKPKSASNEQKEELVRIFEEYNQRPKQENAETDYKERQRFWIEATHRLNKIPGGTMKSTAKWVKYWADVIINLKRKCKLVIEGRSKKIGPSPLEVRILSAATCYDVLDLWTKALSSDGIGVLETSMSGDVHEEYFPDDSGVQKEEIVIEHYASDDPLDEEFVASFSKPVDHCEDHSQETSVTTELEIRKPTVEELKNLTNAVTTAEYVELTTSAALEASTSEFLRPKVVHRSVTSSASTSTSTPVNVAAASASTDRLREDLKRTSEKLESVMKRRRLDDSKFAIAQALTNMSAALLQLSNGMNELANALTNDAM
ncbi:conserved hypothetical protein [Culex quinquefasciatus]|uniref:Uncharacterized protein n=1 Tax=Culex quinquefasciatus TaxID=7176 RepID=B0VZS0_CULQU|nr:uncharacterized protein LOC6031109 [Culex quinquefasciatus]XP_039435967.1 uncharacterized protein LOC120417820 [Culex pipiens pallens]EDS35162.1 conserved hypothetical protein [Culex quinquefasciatus]|eukprot:XP_001841954.1 conserved hypothetical protein [Culex quinquefasciatus]